MAPMPGKSILVTGASGLVALPVAVELAKNNEFFADQGFGWCGRGLAT